MYDTGQGIARDDAAALNWYQGANTEMELPLYQGFMVANLPPPQLQVALPIDDHHEFRGPLHDLLLTVWQRAEALKLPLDRLGDPATLASRLV